MFVCLFFFFCLIKLSYWNSFAVAFLAIKIKSYLHDSSTQLFEYLHIHNILKYIENENLKP